MWVETLYTKEQSGEGCIDQLLLLLLEQVVTSSQIQELKHAFYHRNLEHVDWEVIVW